MKKSKIFVVIALAVVLCIVSVTSTTFSWFTRPRTESGNRLLLPAKTYDISNGNNVTFSTYESSDDGVSYGTEVANFAGPVSIAPGKRKMYRTDVTNTGKVPQSVSLFLSDLRLPAGSDGQFYLGVNNPLKTFKNAFNNDGKVDSYVNQRNYYVGFVKDGKPYNPSEFYIHYWHGYADSSADSIGNSRVGSTKVGVGKYKVSSYNNYETEYNMYCATIPYEANALCLMKDGKSEAFDAGNNITIDKLNTVIWFHYNKDNDGNDDNDYHNAYMLSGVSAGIERFYSSAQVKVGNTIDLAATGQGTITYSSSDNSIATVDNKGVVTGVKAGRVTIKVKSKGAYGDEIESPCVVNVYSASSNVIDLVPVVTNVRVDAATEEGATTKSIYWYIKNNSTDATLNYTLSGLDLTL